MFLKHVYLHLKLCCVGEITIAPLSLRPVSTFHWFLRSVLLIVEISINALNLLVRVDR